MRALAIVVFAGCGSSHTDVGNVAAPPPTKPATAWATACRDAVARGRDAAAAIEPKLATMPVELDRDREAVSAYAFPPTWQVAPVRVSVGRSPEPREPQPTWQTHAHFELGGDHRIALRRVGDVEAMIGLDGWNPQLADRVISAFEAALDPCFLRSGGR